MGFSAKLEPLWEEFLGPLIFPHCLIFMVPSRHGGGVTYKAMNAGIGTEKVL